MIKGVHAMFFTKDAEGCRAFIRDVLELPAHDVGEGWLIFDAPEAEVGCHPTEGDQQPFHGISFYTDDIDATRATLEERGVEFCGPIVDAGWGRVCSFVMPGEARAELYQPQYAKGA